MGIITVTFIIGYLFITLEHVINVNKAASALLTGVLCWTFYAFYAGDPESITEQLSHHLGKISGIIFFLMGAMTIVELVDAHDGFDVITNAIKTSNKQKLIWIICILSFLLSAVLDNLTTTIVMVSLLRKLIADKNDRLLLIGMVVIAANAGGVWSPIGDVTTTMLWIGGRITTKYTLVNLFLPSLVCMIVPLIFVTFRIKGKVNKVAFTKAKADAASTFERKVIFFSGIGVLLFVPVFKTTTHLPPFMGMLFGLGLLWIISEIIHKDKDEIDKNAYSVLHALRKIDMPSVLFFLGILISISAIESTGQLKQFASVMEAKIGNVNILVLSIGLLSAIVDNVPIVAASMGMYDLQVYAVDHYFWGLLAYSAGTGGSALIIGSAAGVAAMGMEKISFFWYLRNITLLALLGYFSGAIVFILQSH
ncbi:sodium:proton antiporter NhaD [Solitalea koreensis]|uniref:Sodium/proton antiporter, NhaD family n=1 Tax=Solitalea koreensis TaxID=543615 RepID=A0A521CGR1_9SPHI|nr:sodium:proton antiporter NhaD [Solitalea koreensis]SMO57930.1 sodium/proton antiporter, NhaD family [Solitalea koreensis]